MRKLIMLIMVSGLIFTSSCKKDKVGINGCDYLSYLDVFNTEFNDWQLALTNYSNSQSTANCEAYKSATTDYLNALRGWEDCARELNFLDDLQDSIDDAIEETEDLEC